MRERLDTIERLLEAKGSLTRADIERYVPDRDAALERGSLTREYICRVMRAVQQDLDAIASTDQSIEEVRQRLLES